MYRAINLLAIKKVITTFVKDLRPATIKRAIKFYYHGYKACLLIVFLFKPLIRIKWVILEMFHIFKSGMAAEVNYV